MENKMDDESLKKLKKYAERLENVIAGLECMDALCGRIGYTYCQCCTAKEVLDHG